MTYIPRILKATMFGTDEKCQTTCTNFGYLFWVRPFTYYFIIYGYTKRDTSTSAANRWNVTKWERFDKTSPIFPIQAWSTTDDSVPWVLLLLPWDFSRALIEHRVFSSFDRTGARCDWRWRGSIWCVYVCILDVNLHFHLESEIWDSRWRLLVVSSLKIPRR